MSSKLIIALDFSTAEQALRFIKPLSPEICKLKVGFELFVATGPEFVKKIVEMGFDVFLDLKFHDIPNTVASACQSAAQLGVWMMNVHASGGDKMMRAAHQALEQIKSDTKLIAVTVLTSMDEAQLATCNINVSAPQQVKHLAKIVQQSSLDGVVCSAQEAEMLRVLMGKDFLLVTPGIRPAGFDLGDQSRIMTPAEACQAGVSFVVVGRPITRSDNPLSVIDAINHDMS